MPKISRDFLVALTALFALDLVEKLSDRFLPIYLLAVGGGTFAVALFGALDNLLGALYALPGGYLADRFGSKRALMFFNALSALGYLIAVLWPSWQGALLGAVLFSSWSAISLPAIMSLVAKTMPRTQRTLGATLHSLIRRFPMMLGPVLGGLLIASYGERDGIRIAFLLGFLVSFASIFLQGFLMDDRPKESVAVGMGESLRRLFRARPELRRLLVSDILVRYCEQIPQAFVVVWCLKEVGITAAEFGLLTTIEMTTAILVYLPVVWMVERHGAKKPFIAVTFAFFSLFPLILLFSRSLPALALAFFVRGLKEFGEPTRKALILDFAEGPGQGALYGAYYLVRDLLVAGAALLGGILWMQSPALALLAASAFGVLGTLYLVFFCRE